MYIVALLMKEAPMQMHFLFCTQNYEPYVNKNKTKQRNKLEQNQEIMWNHFFFSEFAQNLIT